MIYCIKCNYKFTTTAIPAYCPNCGHKTEWTADSKEYSTAGYDETSTLYKGV